MREVGCEKRGRIYIYKTSCIAFFITIVVLCRCVRLPWVFNLACILLLILYGITSYKQRNLSFTRLDMIVILLVLIYCYNNQFDSLMAVASYIIAWLSFFVFKRDKMFFKGTMMALVIFSIINLLVNILNLISTDGYYSFVNMFLTNEEASNAIKAVNRGYLCGISGHYSRNAYFCVIGVTVAFSQVLSGKKKHRWFWIIIAVAMTLMLMRIGKRGHFLFLFASVLLVYLMLGASISQKIKRLLFFGVVGVMLLGIAIEFLPSVVYVFQRFVNVSGNRDITSGRIQLYIQAIKFFLSNPILGIGHGNFILKSESYFGMSYAGVHNDYLQWLCETGIIGFILQMYFLVGVYSLSFKELKLFVTTKKKVGTYEQVLIIWSVMFQTFIILYSFTGIPHYDREVFPIYYMACAVPFALKNNLEYSQKCKKMENKIILCMKNGD